ncbi:zinc carboxypeptidase-like [Melitaea cinxia]|uniref:zinc carboxypeptidase-like n=1 Tax=Melitaea cinxia TaxID=113334 RepID=UPI001E270FEF|nr:zinc carboxypeptidase-like [Melitaea cinxia]
MKTQLFLFFLLFLIDFSVALNSKYKNYINYKYYDIKSDENTLENLVKVLKEKDNTLIYANEKTSAQLIVAPELESVFLELTRKAKINTTLLYNDISEVIRSEKPVDIRKNRKGFSWDAYYDVDDIYNYLSNVSETYPQWTEIIVGGKSYEGRQIKGIRINTPTEDGVEKPVFFIEAGIHAREWIAPATTTYFINQLLTSSNGNITRLRDQFDWRIFPTVNPDGYHYSYVFDRYWRKTRSISHNGCIGADPNRNWDYNWGQHSASTNPCDYQLYAGSRPFSEIETRTLSSYISGIDNLLFYVGFHSYASLLLIPYSDSTVHVHNYDDLVAVGKTSLDYGENRERYKGPATAAEALYKASGGSMDWVRYTFNTPFVYTYELRGSSFHWPAKKIPEQGDEVTQMILGLADGAKNLGYY